MCHRPISWAQHIKELNSWAAGHKSTQHRDKQTERHSVRFLWLIRGLGSQWEWWEGSRIVTPACLWPPGNLPSTCLFEFYWLLQGYAGEPRAFIATQGPMTHTVEDFWRMVWLQRVPIIIMITKLKEKNKVLLVLGMSDSSTKLKTRYCWCWGCLIAAQN